MSGLSTISWGPVGFVSGTFEAFEAEIAASKVPVQAITANPEMILMARRDEGFKRAFLGVRYRTVDGVGLAWVLKKLTQGPVDMLTGADFSGYLLDRWKTKGLYLLGSTPENVQAAAEALRARGVTVSGYHHGFFKPEEDAGIAAEIRASGAYWLLVGMGAPRQDVFLYQHLEDTGVHFAMGVGGVLDLLAGQAQRAPAIWQKMKLEWLYRLIKNPSRWRRYMQLLTFIPFGLKAVALKRPPFETSVTA